LILDRRFWILDLKKATAQRFNPKSEIKNPKSIWLQAPHNI